jgi:hypothetical protein
MGTIEIIITTISLTTIFWLSAFSYLLDKKRNSDKTKINRIFKQKKW